MRLLIAALLPLILLAACSSVPVQSPAPRTSSATPPARPASGTPAPAPATKRGGAFYLDDGPGDNAPVDLAAIPDAVPRIEPIRASTTRPYEVMGQSFKPMSNVKPFSQTGVGSWYGKKFHGAKTASGEAYDMYGMTAAHPTLPIPSYARVTNLENGRQVVVRVNDRGPFLHSRIMDLSYTAAWKLGYVSKGSARLQVDAITPDEIGSGSYLAAANPPAPAEPPAPAPQPVAVTAPAAPTLPVSAPVREAAAADPDPIAAMTTEARVEPATAPAAMPAGSIFLQLGAFASSANADSFRDYVQSELKWLRQGVNTRLVGDKYRLHVGPFSDLAEARSVADRIASSIGTRPFVVR
ncbi:septal ring lytic transglycosylase RlpA family protein [Uliginosibacterium paludis]|uniref:Endolytic peptidoglycan transglycosylase RlpA n=1 Tax=Uliginosibacterium paludis TaxID=1615952 RepID=A0ABV2CSR0_9RHOO